MAQQGVLVKPLFTPVAMCPRKMRVKRVQILQLPGTVSGVSRFVSTEILRGADNLKKADR